MRVEPISRELLSDQVYDMIRASILDGSSEPGSRLVESEIARNLQVSQAPVREAIKRLVHDGLVSSVPRKGSYVTAFSQEEFLLARELRATVEALGARVSTTVSTEEDLKALERVVARMSVAVKGQDWAGFRLLDMEFHATALAIAGQPVLSRVWNALEPALLSQRAIGDPAFAKSSSTVVRWHEELVVALRSRSPERAAAAFFDHAAGSLPAVRAE